MRPNKLLMGIAGAAVLAGSFFSTEIPAQAEDSIYVPLLTYRTGPFAGSGIPIADGMHDYFTMLNERDGGIGGVRIEVEECETAYNAQKGVECYEGTKGNNPVMYNPYSTGITLQLIPKAPVDKIPVLSMGYGLSATAVGETFPWTFNAPITYWSGLSTIIKYIESQGDGIKGQKIGYIYLDVGYGREPLPLLDALAEKMGFTVVKIPVGVKEMQNQSSHWLQVRKEKPDWVVMWGWGAMNPTAIKEAAKIKFPMDRFLGVWWSGSSADMRPTGEGAKGYMALTMHGNGADYPAIQDILKYVVDAGKSQSPREIVGDSFYNRGVYNAIVMAEAIRNAQIVSGKKLINGEDMRLGLESLNITTERLAEIGLTGFMNPLQITCQDHSGAHSVYLQRWTGSDWETGTDWITPMTDVVRPMLEAAAADYLADKPDWQTQTCD